MLLGRESLLPDVPLVPVRDRRLVLVLGRVFRVRRRVQTLREVVRYVVPSLVTVALTVVMLVPPRVLPSPVKVFLTVDPPLVGSPLLHLPSRPLAVKTPELVVPTPLTCLPLLPLPVLPVPVLLCTCRTLRLARFEEVLTWTPRLPFAFPLPVDMPRTLPVLTLNAILTRGMLCGVVGTLLKRKWLTDPPLWVSGCLFR